MYKDMRIRATPPPPGSNLRTIEENKGAASKGAASLPRKKAAGPTKKELESEVVKLRTELKHKDNRIEELKAEVKEARQGARNEPPEPEANIKEERVDGPPKPGVHKPKRDGRSSGATSDDSRVLVTVSTGGNHTSSSSQPSQNMVGKAQTVGNLGPHGNATIALAPQPSVTKDDARAGMGEWAAKYGRLFTTKGEVFDLVDGVWSERRGS